MILSSRGRQVAWRTTEFVLWVAGLLLVIPPIPSVDRQTLQLWPRVAPGVILFGVSRLLAVRRGEPAVWPILEWLAFVVFAYGVHEAFLVCSRT